MKTSTNISSHDNKVIIDFLILTEIVELFRLGFKSRNTQIRDVLFLKNTLQNMWVNFFFNIFLHSYTYFGSKDTFIRTGFFGENCFYSYIYISTLLFYDTQMKTPQLSRSSPIMSLIGEVCNRLRTV